MKYSWQHRKKIKLNNTSGVLIQYRHGHTQHIGYLFYSQCIKHIFYCSQETISECQSCSVDTTANRRAGRPGRWGASFVQVGPKGVLTRSADGHVVGLVVLSLGQDKTLRILWKSCSLQ